MNNQSVLLRYDDLKARGIVRNRTTLYRWIKKGLFPPGFMIGENTRVWTDEVVDQHLAERARASAETKAA